jgi:hypothetical protein
MQKWEYKNIVITLNGTKVIWYEDNEERPASSPAMFPKAKELGEQGWEMVSVTSWATVSQTLGTQTVQWVYWFKRAK